MAEIPHKVRLQLNNSSLAVGAIRPSMRPTVKKSFTKMAVSRPPTFKLGNSYQSHQSFAH